MSIETKELTASYGRHGALRDVTAAAAPGAITAVVGPNAAGKSTLLKCIIGALRPASGAVLINRRPAHRWPARQLAAQIAYVPQRSTVAAAFTVREVVRLGRYALPRSPHRIEEAIERLQLSSIADRPYPQLSVGQQQRVTLARALAQLEPEGHLVLDEPMSAMDLAHVRQAARLLRELANTGATVIIALHDMALAAMLANDTWLLVAGKLEAAGPTDEVLTPERLEATFSVPFDWLTDPNGQRILTPRVALE